ncbi:MAG: class IV adenylate cyclase [Patescibacteria group bacterium]
MKNIELKLSAGNFNKIIFCLKKARARHAGKLCQTDTYYNCRDGRLKLREINAQKFELIFYKRPNTNNSKISNYQILDINKKQAKIIKSILADALRTKNIIKKTRDLWIYKNTRIHLDKVSGLGRFLELETVIKKNIKAAEVEHGEIIKNLKLSKYKKYGKSYSDMF